MLIIIGRGSKIWLTVWPGNILDWTLRIIWPTASPLACWWPWRGCQASSWWSTSMTPSTRTTKWLECHVNRLKDVAIIIVLDQFKRHGKRGTCWMIIMMKLRRIMMTMVLIFRWILDGTPHWPGWRLQSFSTLATMHSTEPAMRLVRSTELVGNGNVSWHWLHTVPVLSIPVVICMQRCLRDYHCWDSFDSFAVVAFINTMDYIHNYGHDSWFWGCSTSVSLKFLPLGGVSLECPPGGLMINLTHDYHHIFTHWPSTLRLYEYDIFYFVGAP